MSEGADRVKRMTLPLEVSSVQKSYGDRQVLRNINFTVEPGKLTGFVGGNGAGKTTTMRIILGLLEPNAGSVLLGDRALNADDRSRFGYMPEERGLYPKMPLLEQIAYFARLHGFSKADAEARATALLTELGLEERLKDKVEALSLGNQQRAQIAAALVHDPEVLILDEPFSGLDPIAVDVVAGVLQERAAAGASVLFSSHQLDVVERLCDNLVIIADGDVRAAGEREALREQHSEPRWAIDTDGDLSWISDIPGIRVLEVSGGHAVFDADSEADAQAVLQRAVRESSVLSFAPRRPSLAQIFKEVIA